MLCAKNLINNEPFAVMSADDFILSPQSCIGEMIKNYNGVNMVATMPVAWENVNRYGILDVERQEGRLVYAKSVDEKPSSKNAKSNIAIVGRYLLSAEIFEVLEHLEPGVNGEIQLTDALLKMIPSCGLVGFNFEGQRFDCGSKDGLLAAILRVASNTQHLKYVIDEFVKEK